MAALQELATNQRQQRDDEAASASGPIHLQRHRTQIALETCSAQSVMNSVLAGYAAGISGTLVGHPFDSLKVWMQTRDLIPHSAPGTSASRSAKISPHPNARTPPGPTVVSANAASTNATRLSPGMNMSSAGSISETVTPASVLHRTRALYAGLTGPLLTVGLIQSINFAIYDSSRRMLYGLQHPEADHMEYLHHDSIGNVSAASFVAGSVLCFVTSPLVIMKVKQQTSQLSFRQALRDTTISPKTMFVGFPLHAASETLGRVVYYATYESLKRALVGHKQRSQTQGTEEELLNGSAGVSQLIGRQPISLVERMGCAASSGILCWSVIFPIDAIRSRLFAQSSASVLQGQSVSIRRMAQSIYAQRGLRGFFRGYSVTVMRAGPVAAAVLPIYDMTLEYLSGLQ